MGSLVLLGRGVVLEYHSTPPIMRALSGTALHPSKSPAMMNPLPFTPEWLAADLVAVCHPPAKGLAGSSGIGCSSLNTFWALGSHSITRVPGRISAVIPNYSLENQQFQCSSPQLGVTLKAAELLLLVEE